MQLSDHDLWQRFQRYYSDIPQSGCRSTSAAWTSPTTTSTACRADAKAFEAMDALEKGAIANPDENRMVGHYWLRNATLAPTPQIRKQIEDTVARGHKVRRRRPRRQDRGRKGQFTNVLIIGIGGSALGPQFVANALAIPKPTK
jgi:glucose-6-phosphate isomerase